MNCSNRLHRAYSNTAGGFCCHSHAILVTAVKYSIQSKPLTGIDLHIVRSTCVRLLIFVSSLDDDGGSSVILTVIGDSARA